MRGHYPGEPPNGKMVLGGGGQLGSDMYGLSVMYIHDSLSFLMDI